MNTGTGGVSGLRGACPTRLALSKLWSEVRRSVNPDGPVKVRQLARDGGRRSGVEAFGDARRCRPSAAPILSREYMAPRKIRALSWQAVEPLPQDRPCFTATG